MEASTSNWWYETNGEQKGPVPYDQIVTLVHNNAISTENLVWKEGTEQWIHLKDSVFSSHFKYDSPPPITGENVNNKIVWWLAFAPVIGKVLEGFFLEMFYPEPSLNLLNDNSVDNYLRYLSNTNFDAFWFVTLGLNFLLCYQDEKILKKAGHDTKKLGSIFLVPVYLFKRAQMLKQNNAYFWVWIIAFIVSLS